MLSIGKGNNLVYFYTISMVYNKDYSINRPLFHLLSLLTAVYFDYSLVRGQCDQIGQNFTTWATLGYFLQTQFLQKQAVSIHGLLWVFKGFKSGLK
jgi:hypothetical protein